jgi:hypothetical protein
MPKCIKCNSLFPKVITREGKQIKLRHRKYCFNCHPLKCFTENQEWDSTCNKCGRNFLYDRKKGHTHNVCNSCLTNKRRVEIKLKLVEAKGGKCIICGYNKCIQALGFHHRDPTTKKFTISGSHNRTMESLLSEIEKCELVCANCHIEVEVGLVLIPEMNVA